MHELWEDAQMRVEVLQVPWIGPSLNVIWSGVHWKVRARVAEDAHWAVKSIARGVKVFTKPVNIEFTPKHRERHFDPTNYAVTAKAIEDGMVLAGILAGDSGKFVHSVKLNAAEKLKATQSYMLVKISEVEGE